MQMRMRPTHGPLPGSLETTTLRDQTQTTTAVLEVQVILTTAAVLSATVITVHHIHLRTINAGTKCT